MMWLRLPQQARYFDAHLYIIKAFIGIFIAYLCRYIPFINKDMISIMFAMMLTLEPYNRAGLAAAKDQLQSTVVGGLCALGLLSLFGLNMITVPLGIALTMYLLLKKDWRFVSPAGYFTAIYMTQYIQQTPAGEHDFFMTFVVRMTALTVGILIGLIVNEVFSRFFYKTLVQKRLQYVRVTLEQILCDHHAGKQVQSQIMSLFLDMDTIARSFDNKSDMAQDTLALYRKVNHYFLTSILNEDSEGMAQVEKLLMQAKEAEQTLRQIEEKG